MACRGEHFPAQAATITRRAESGVVASRSARLAAIFSLVEAFLRCCRESLMLFLISLALLILETSTPL